MSGIIQRIRESIIGSICAFAIYFIWGYALVSWVLTGRNIVESVTDKKVLLLGIAISCIVHLLGRIFSKVIKR